MNNLPKRLYRDEERRVIAGVCAGLATYFELEPTLVRVIFILLTMFGPSMIVVYVILWLLLPVESSPVALTDEVFKQNLSDIKRTATKTADYATQEVKRTASQIGKSVRK